MACPNGPDSPGCNYTLPNASGLPATLDIDVTVDIAGGRSIWSGTVGKQNAGGLCVQSFAMPSMESLRFTPGQEEMFNPYMFGVQGSNSDFAWGSQMPEVAGVQGIGDQNGDNRERGWMPNGWDRTMSWAAWFSSNNATTSSRDQVGLYLGMHDRNSRLKMLPASPRCAKDVDCTAVLRAVHVPDSFDDNSTDSFTVPYQVVVAAVRGWWDAAQIYREWAIADARWTKRGNLSARDDVPAWLLRAPLWLKLSGNYPNHSSTLELADGVKEAFGGGNSAVTDIGIHWYGWNTEAFDTHYPIYTAKDQFGEAVAKMQSPHAGITARIIPYTNGRIWDPAGPLQTVPEEATCKGRNGSAYHEVYGSKVKFSVMDPASEYMQREWSTAVGNITRKFNTSGVYTDQISCSHAEACYNNKTTSASSWAAGSQALLDAMVQKMGPDKVLISESQDETMIGSLHAFLSIYGWLGSMKCQTVLAWQAVYGGWTVNVGDIRYPQHPRIKGVDGKLVLNSTEAAAHRVSSRVYGNCVLLSSWSPNAALLPHRPSAHNSSSLAV
jgi:hypothetical protein